MDTMDTMGIEIGVALEGIAVSRSSLIRDIGISITQ